jgi:cytochrome c553
MKLKASLTLKAGVAAGWVALSALIMPNLALAAGDPAKGKAKSAVCTSCHGANGKAMIPTYPHIAGQNALYLESSLKAYRDGQRTGGQASIMSGMVAQLTNQDIADLAAYFSSLK